MKTKLLFVYNADGNLFSKVTDFAHKIFSPSTYTCSLCRLTYDNFGMKKEWAEFIKSIKIPVKFFYKNDFEALYPNYTNNYPVVFLANKKNMVTLISAAEIGEVNTSGNLSELINLVHLKMQSMSIANSKEGK